MGHEVVILSDRDVRDMIRMSAVIETVENDFKRQAAPDDMIYGVPLAYETDDRELGFRWRMKTAIIRPLPVAGVRVTGYKIDASGVGSGGESASTRFIVLSDPVTSTPLAIIDEHSSFAMRTSAAVCVAAKYLARSNSRIAAIIGVGNVGRTALLGLLELFSLDEVKVMSARPESRRRFAEEMSKALGVRVVAVDSYEEACRGADIIMAGTPSTAPFIRHEWLKEGVFVGVMGHNEATNDVFEKCDRFFVDYDPSKEKHPAHIRAALDAIGGGAGKVTGQIWEVVTGRIPARKDPRERILVATVGLTTQDIAIGYQLYLEAKVQGRGLRLPM
jgi:ornithine cyclodeaminase/alanine dehydrogenase-like protein (mu-crystallin family)